MEGMGVRGDERGDSPQILHTVGRDLVVTSDDSSDLISAAASVVISARISALSSVVTSVATSACIANATAADLEPPAPPLPLPSAPVWSLVMRCVGFVSVFVASDGAWSAGGGSLGRGSGGSVAAEPVTGVVWEGVETAWEEWGEHDMSPCVVQLAACFRELQICSEDNMIVTTNVTNMTNRSNDSKQKRF